LYDIFDGGKKTVNSQNCNIPVSALSNIIKGEEKPVLYIGGNAEGLSWINYVHAYL
jgi:hypothetical protein